MTIIPYVNNLNDLKTQYINNSNINQLNISSELLSSFIGALHTYCDDYKDGHIEEEIINENVKNLFNTYASKLSLNDFTYLYNYFKPINEDVSNFIKNYIFL